MDPIEVAQTLSEAGADASLWFCFGGEPDAPGFVLVNRASDPKGVEFGPQAKALAALGPATNGIATRKAGGPLSLISRSPFPGLIEGLASWAAAGLARAPGLEALRDARFTQVDAQNQVVETQEDPAAWARLDAAPAPDAAPVPAPDPATAQTLLALEKGAASCWFWLSQPDDNGVPTFILIDRTEDPKGVAFGGFMRDAVEAGAPAAGAARGIATFKEGSPPSLVARSAYADCIAALVAWRQTW